MTRVLYEFNLIGPHFPQTFHHSKPRNNPVPTRNALGCQKDSKPMSTDRRKVSVFMLLLNAGGFGH